MNIEQHSFDVTKRLEFLGRPRGEVYYGVELELECAWEKEDGTVFSGEVWEKHLGEYYANNCKCYKCLSLTSNSNKLLSIIEKEFKDFIIPKRDGSLKHGVELVTAPASLTIHQNRWKKLLSQLPKKIGAKPSCGMHVHMSKKPFTARQRGELHQFLNSRGGTQAWLEWIAGRRKNEYWLAVKKEPGREESYFPEGKYELLNLSPTYTMEMRIFASTIKYNILAKNIEFCAALCQMLRAGEKFSIDRVHEYVKDHKELYPSLAEFLSTKSARNKWVDLDEDEEEEDWNESEEEQLEF